MFYVCVVCKFQYNTIQIGRHCKAGQYDYVPLGRHLVYK